MKLTIMFSVLAVYTAYPLVYVPAMWLGNNWGAPGALWSGLQVLLGIFAVGCLAWAARLSYLDWRKNV